MKHSPGHVTRRLLRFDELFFEHPDEFYELHYNNIFCETHELVRNAFCTDEYNYPANKSPWTRKFPDQFCKYVEMLARPDPHSGKWTGILRDHEERGFLLQAIILKVLDSQIFSSLLFGADVRHTKVLRLEDASLLNVEGFRRSSLRAHTNRIYMESVGQVPPRFWDQVDEVCSRILALLLPMYNYVGEFDPLQQPSIEKLYQSLHDVISYAGWLNIGIRLSPAIFVSNWPTPGRRYNMDQVNVSRKLYEQSKEMAVRKDHDFSKSNPARVQPKRVARIKVAIAPQVTRYSTGFDVGARGMNIYTVMKPHAVYYYGIDSSLEDEKTYISLADYIERLNRVRRPPPNALTLVALLFCCLLIALFRFGFFLRWKETLDHLKNLESLRPLLQFLGEVIHGIKFAATDEMSYPLGSLAESCPSE